MLYPVTLDKERNFKFGMRALRNAERRMGRAIMGMDLSTLTMDDIGTLAWCGLIHEDNKLTVDNVIDLIDDYSSLAEILEIVGNAIQEAFGVKVDEQENEETDGKN